MSLRRACEHETLPTIPNAAFTPTATLFSYSVAVVHRASLGRLVCRKPQTSAGPKSTVESYGHCAESVWCNTGLHLAYGDQA
jgi:hypothetical protein